MPQKAEWNYQALKSVAREWLATKYVQARIWVAYLRVLWKEFRGAEKPQSGGEA